MKRSRGSRDLMTAGRRAPALAALGLIALACARPAPFQPGPPLPCPTVPAGTGFRAGFARVDITTPPGPGLLGYGPEGRATRGYRQRLHARAAALEDARGERVVLVVADLGFVSAALHRAVAERVAACAGLGADRIVLSATHTHAGPAHYAAHASYDRYGSAVDGFDPAILEFLSTRIARAALEALAALRPARAAWGERPVWGITRIRSWAAHAADPHPLPSAHAPPDSLRDERYRHVDPTLILLRVDTGAARPAPAGAFALFAAHGTGIPALNDLLDADVHGIAARVLERHIDARNGTMPEWTPRGVAVFGNGAEGDVLPARDSIRACDPPVLRRAFRPTGRGGPPGEEAWIAGPGQDARACVDHGIARTIAVGRALGDAASGLFDSLDDVLSSDVRLGVAYRMVPLRGADAPAGLCARGRTGTATVAGAETGRTRLLGFRLLGLIPAGFESGGSAVDPGSACGSPKRTIPSFIERLVAGDHPFEEAAQFTVLRIGDALLATVPFEATTTVGARLRDALRTAAAATPDPPARAAIIGIANGYLNYVTTETEYAHQHYEGASTLYGPASAAAYTSVIVDLARALAAGGWTSPPATVSPFPFPVTTARAILPRAAPDPERTRRPPWLHAVDDAAAVIRWTDDRPGAHAPGALPLLVIERRTPEGWTRVALDDDPETEIRLIAERGPDATWQVRWAHGCSAGTYRVRLLARERLPEETIMFDLAECGGTS